MCQDFPGQENRSWVSERGRFCDRLPLGVCLNHVQGSSVAEATMSCDWVLPLSLLLGFLSLCVAFVVPALVSQPGLYSPAYMTVAPSPFSRSLLRRMFFLPYAYDVLVFSLFLLFYFWFVFVFSLVSLLAHEVICWLLFCDFPSVCFPCFFSPTVFPG